MDSNSKSYLRAMTVTACFVTMTQNGLSWPTIVFFGKQFGASTAFFGWVVATYLAVQLFSIPIWTAISDRIGRRPVLLIGLVGSALAMAVMASATSLEWIFVSRLLSGIFGANIAIIGACAADVATPEERTKTMGKLEAATTVGQWIIGPFLGGFLSDISLATPYYVACGLGIATLAYAALNIKETKRSPAAGTSSAAAPEAAVLSSKQRMSMVFANKNVAGGIIIMFMLGLAMGPLDVVYAIMLKDAMGMNAKDISLLIVFLGAMVIPLQIYLTPALSKRLGEQNLVSIGTMLLSFAMLLLGSIKIFLPALLWVAILEKIIFAFGYAFLFSPLASVVGGSSAPETKGTAMGLFRAANQCGRILAPLGAFVYDSYSPWVAFLGISCLFTVTSLFCSTWGWIPMFASPAAGAIRKESGASVPPAIVPFDQEMAPSSCEACGQPLPIQTAEKSVKAS